MRKSLSILIALAVFIMAAGSAHAFSLGGYNGPVKVKFSDWEIIAYSGALSDGIGDNLGVLKVTSIEDLAANQLWSELSSGEQITGIFYALDIAAITPVDTNGDFIPDSFRVDMSNAAITGKMDLFLQSTSDLFYTPADPTLGPGPASIATFTDGASFLTFDFVPGILPGGVTVSNLISGLSIIGSGSGQGFAAVTGGSNAGMFDSNGYLAGAADIYITYDFFAPGSFGWTINSEDPTYANVVPEPGTLLLLGAGLVGIGAAARLRRKS